MTAISRLSSLSALTVAVLLTLWTSTSLMGADVFKMFDWNEDGVLSGNEAKPFLILDLDPSDGPDGEITRKEFDAGLTVFENALLGIDLNSPQIENLHERMFADLLADRNKLLSKFAKFYSKSCETMIRHVMDKEDTAAFEMFHPDIQKQVGNKPFLEVFRTIRNQCGTQSVQVELESAGVDFDENGKGRFFTISHRLSGPKGKVLVTHNMQFVGLKAFFVAMSIEPVKDEGDSPTDDGADLPSAVDNTVPPKP